MPRRPRHNDFNFEGVAALVTAVAKLLHSFAFVVLVFAFVFIRPELLGALVKSLTFATGNSP